MVPKYSGSAKESGNYFWHSEGQLWDAEYSQRLKRRLSLQILKISNQRRNQTGLQRLCGIRGRDPLGRAGVGRRGRDTSCQPERRVSDGITWARPGWR